MPKKPTQLSPEQFQQLLIATANLPVAHLEPLQGDYLQQVLETPLNFQMRVEVVVKALEHFRKQVQTQHGIHTYQDLVQALGQFADTDEDNKACANWLFGNNHWTRVALLRRFLEFLGQQQLTDLAGLTSWAEQAVYERDFKGKVKGMGRAVFNWLLLRLGVQTIKPDVWVLNFGQRILGQRIPDVQLIEALMDIAPLVGRTPIHIDRTLWHHERMGLSENDCPGLRVVWWHLFCPLLLEYLEKTESQHERQWQLTMDDGEWFRYQKAGITLTPVQRTWESVQLTHVRVQQLVWHQGFALWLEVKVDAALTLEGLASVAAALEDEGWELENTPAGVVALLDLETELLVSPDWLLEDLREWAQEVAEAVGDAVVQLEGVLKRL